MLIYCQELRKLENNFDGLEYLYILWGRNVVADELAKLGSNWVVVPVGVFMQKLHEPSITKALAKASKAAESSQEMSYLILWTKLSTHRMCAQDHLFHTHRRKVFTDSQMSWINYYYYINNCP
jgi:hypothetical protein